MFLIYVLEPCEEQQCEFICIVSDESTTNCLCPDGFLLDSNGRNCTRNYNVRYWM